MISLPHSPSSHPNQQKNKQPHKRGGCYRQQNAAGIGRTSPEESFQSIRHIMHVFKKHRCKFIFVWMDCIGDSPGERGYVLLPARKDPAKGKIRAHREAQAPPPRQSGRPAPGQPQADPMPSTLHGSPWTAFPPPPCHFPDVQESPVLGVGGRGGGQLSQGGLALPPAPEGVDTLGVPGITLPGLWWAGGWGAPGHKQKPRTQLGPLHGSQGG